MDFLWGWRTEWEEMHLFLNTKYEDLLGHLDRGDQMTGKEIGLGLMGSGAGQKELRVFSA